MHNVVIPDWARERVIARRGTEHVHMNINPLTTALIVVDLQNAFMKEDVALSFVPNALKVVPNVNKLAASVRAAGGKVFWIKHTVDDTSRDEWSNWIGMMRQEIQHKTHNMEVGSEGHEIHDTLDIHPEDEIVLKYRFSAFVQGASDLPERLRAQGYDTVLITGTLTNVCCESSARDAMMLNFKTVMISDGCATLTDSEHNATLTSIYTTFGDVMDTDLAIKCLEKNGRSIAAE